MNIILEGVDRSGKSTVCKWLGQDPLNVGHNLSDSYIHFTAAQTKEFDTDICLKTGTRLFPQFTDIMNKLKPDLESGKSLIFDRFFYSDYVYGPTYKNFRKPITVNEILNLEFRFKLLNTKTVVLWCQIEDINKNWELIQEEGKSLMTFNMLKTFRERYKEIMSKATLPVIHYDWTNPKHNLKEMLFPYI